jgi:hypothetical protein
MTARAPYRIVRMHQGGLYFLACLEGEGRVLVDGTWKKCSAGMAVALPPFMVNAFHAVPGKIWRCCWVRYEQQPEQTPISEQQLACLWLAICRHRALAAPSKVSSKRPGHESKPAAMFHWVELIQHYIERFAQPWQVDDRLHRIWEKVSANVGHRLDARRTRPAGARERRAPAPSLSQNASVVPPCTTSPGCACARPPSCSPRRT